MKFCQGVVRTVAPILRLWRLVQSTERWKLDAKSRYGVEGELQVGRSIQSLKPQFHIANPVVPTYDGVIRETDHLVLYGGALFAVEVKNHRWKFCQSDEPGKLQRTQFGKRGQPPKADIILDPLVQATGFIRHLKAYLAAKCDRRFDGLYVYAVAAFTRNSDIDEIHSLEHTRGLGPRLFGVILTYLDMANIRPGSHNLDSQLRTQ